MRVCDKHRTSHANQDKCEQEQTPKSHAWWFQSFWLYRLQLTPGRLINVRIYASQTLWRGGGLLSTATSVCYRSVKLARKKKDETYYR
jgi:hypothetical protein